MSTSREFAEALLGRVEGEEGEEEKGEDRGGTLSRASLLAAVSSNDVVAVRDALMRWKNDRVSEKMEDWDLDAKDVIFVHPKQGTLGRCAQVRKGWTLSHLAAYHGCLETLGFLISAGADVTSETADGDRLTPLHCAAAGGSPKSAEVIGLLLQCGADKEAKDARGRRPADLLPPSEEFKGCNVEDRERVYSPRKESMFERGEGYGRPSYEINRDEYETDEFRMYSFKVVKCPRSRAHDWTECPFAHPGEKARRRDPRRYTYSGTACPDFRKGTCKRGDACEHAHGVFECWLHPSRYRTQLCKDGTACTRKVCFFAHRPEELRIPSYQWTPTCTDASSPTSTLEFGGTSSRSHPSSTPPHARRSLDGQMAAEYMANQIANLEISRTLHPWSVDSSALPSSSLPEEGFAPFPSAVLSSQSREDLSSLRLCPSSADACSDTRELPSPIEDWQEKEDARLRVNSLEIFNDFVNDLVEEDEDVRAADIEAKISRRSVDSQLPTWNLFAY